MNANIFSSYAQEIDQYWKYKESQQEEFRFASPQLGLRNHLVEWLRIISAKLNVSHRTVHLAVYVLDMFMDKHKITKDRLGFVALVCLMLAAKFEEIDKKIPSIPELNRFDGFRYSTKDFALVEGMVLRSINFGLAHPTIAHFAEYYATVTVLPQDQKVSELSLHMLEDAACKCIMEFLDMCLKEIHFLRNRPSKVAAACMYATRYRMNLTPTWTDVLSDVTGYSEEDVSGCVKLLMRTLEQEKKKNRNPPSPDSGYTSETP